MLAFVFLALLGPADEAAEKVRFPADEVLLKWSSKSDTHANLIKFITNRREWTKSFETIQGKLGISPTIDDIQVSLEEAENGRLAWSTGASGRGTVVFNMKLLAPHQKKLDDVDLEIRGGKLAPWIIPPQRLDSLLTHELTHVLCGGIEERWLSEGLASFAAGDESYFYNFTRRSARVDAVNGSLSEIDLYPRGMSFCRWLEQQHGTEKLKEFVSRVAGGREKADTAASDVLGLPWEQILSREKVWSTEYLSKFTTIR